MNTKLIEHSDSLQAEAEQIPESTILINILEKVGQTELIGSTRLKTLYRSVGT